jgi:hypothetical protein
MSIRIARIIDMVLRVLGFLHANPADDLAWQAALRRLEDCARKLQALAAQERTGHITAEAAAVTKEDLRAKLHDFLTILARLATLATRADPTMPVRLSLPRRNSGQQTYLNSGRAVLSEARDQQAVLTEFGMTPEFLGEFESTLNAYEHAIGEKFTGTSAHLGANAEMRALASEIIRLVKVVDAIHRPLFRHDADKRAAWKSSRKVVRTLPKTDTVPVEPAEPTVPPKDSAHPAA